MRGCAGLPGPAITVRAAHRIEPCTKPLLLFSCARTTSCGELIMLHQRFLGDGAVWLGAGAGGPPQHTFTERCEA